MTEIDNRREHTQVKLELYRLYLESYLSVLVNARYVRNITIFDIFAGSVTDDNNKKGSARIAAEVIKDFLGKGKKFLWN